MYDPQTQAEEVKIIGKVSQFNSRKYEQQVRQMGNPQTDVFMNKLELPHTGITVPYAASSKLDTAVEEHLKVTDSNEISLEDC